MIEILLCALLLPALLPAFSLLALTLAALPRRARAAPSPGAAAPRTAVLIPAHDESAHVVPTIRNVRAQLGPHDRVLVVADNCGDDTAQRAREAGAEVVERCDPQRRGKGHALAFGVDALRADPPDVVLVVDADCALDDGAVARIAAECHALGRPVQMLDLMQAPASASLRTRVLEFAMVMKNQVRPLGTDRLGGVCQLMGTGMALPWPVVAQARLATGHVAEDMKLGVALTLAGCAPRFLADVGVRSTFVEDGEVARRQKARWEHGHLDTLRQELPALVRDAWRQRDRAIAVLAMDLMIPPVALYFLVMCGLVLAAAAGAAWWPAMRPAAWLVGTAAAAFGLAIGLGWQRFGRRLLRPAELLRLPLYALWKLPVYLAYVAGARSGWNRTRRDAIVPGPR